jgi:murein DD-endopeptidase MepM/ murein hydrolase activator NlpD
VAGFNWNLGSDDDSRSAEVTPAASLPSRRELRERETARAARATVPAPKMSAPKKPSASRAPKGRAPKSAPGSRPSTQRTDGPHLSGPHLSGPRIATSRVVSSRPVSAKRKSRGGAALRKLVTVSAMLGAAALLVATSLPAVALHANSASALAPIVGSQPDTGIQSLAVDKTAAQAAPSRDPYTVVNTMQQSRMGLGKPDFQYTNDTNGTIQWPFPAPVPISSGFGGRTSPCSGCTSFHEGIDFIPGAGTPIGAIADGTVTYAAYDSGFGYHVIIDHNINGQKVQSVYAHMIAGSIKVTVGQQVTVTQELGEVGSTGHSTGAHLHLEVHLDGTPVDPFAWLKANAN